MSWCVWVRWCVEEPRSRRGRFHPLAWSSKTGETGFTIFMSVWNRLRWIISPSSCCDLSRRHSASNPKRPRVLSQTDSVLSQIITIIHGCQRLATLTHRNQAHHSQIKGAGLVPVRMRSILSATRSASSHVKHMGGLNLRTLRWGPSVLRRIFSSFSLKHGVYYPFIIVYHRQSVENLVNKQGPSVNNNVIIQPINTNNR